MKPAMRIASEVGKSLPKRLNLTEAMLPALACPVGKRRVRIYDSKVRGLAYAITANDARAWYWVGRVKGLAQPVDFHIGNASDVPLIEARRRAAKVAAQAAEGIDPRQDRKERKAAAAAAAQSAVTIEQLWEKYRDEHLKPKGSLATLRTDCSRYKLHLSAWRKKSVKDIQPDDVKAFHRQLTASKTPNVADKTIKLLRRMLTFAEVNPNPAGGRAVRFNGETCRDRFLSVEELERLMKALNNAANQTIADAIRFALLTGARRGNVCSARWQDIHLDQGLWIIPRDQSKNKRPMPIALVPAAILLLRERQKTQAAWLAKRAKRLKLAKPEACPFVFNGRTPDEPVREVKSTWQAVCEAAGIEKVRFHDLRHTLASHMAMSGASLLLIGKQLGHASKQSTMRYAHLEIAAVRPATEAAVAAMFGKAMAATESDDKSGKGG